MNSDFMIASEVSMWNFLVNDAFSCRRSLKYITLQQPSPRSYTFSILKQWRVHSQCIIHTDVFNNTSSATTRLSLSSQHH